jgi:hypothetical protein
MCALNRDLFLRPSHLLSTGHRTSLVMLMRFVLHTHPKAYTAQNTLYKWEMSENPASLVTS